MYRRLSASFSTPANATPKPAPLRRSRAIIGLAITSLLILAGERANAMSNIQCEIRSRPVANGLELVGVVWAPHQVQGEYSFSVTSKGSGGSSNVSQSGVFVLEPNEAKMLGKVMVNSGAGSSFAARLSINAANGADCIAAQ